MASNKGAGMGQPNMNMNSGAGRMPAGQPAARPSGGYVQQPQGQAGSAGQAAPHRPVGGGKPARPFGRAGKGPVEKGGTGSGKGSSNGSNGRGQQPGNKRTILIVAGIVVAALAVWLLIWLFACNGNSLLDPTAQDGQAPYKTEAEKQAELDRVVEEGMFNISIQSSILFENGTASGTANIENVPGNHYNMKVSITDDDTGDLLYESGVLKPNQFIEKITLAKDLEPGTYNATATFTALDETTFDEVGQAAAKVTITVAG